MCIKFTLTMLCMCIKPTPTNFSQHLPLRVPHLPPDEPLGPDNPEKELSETWTACWDKEAGATYYYNKISGEATWLPPEL
jgi:hypothetical protein